MIVLASLLQACAVEQSPAYLAKATEVAKMRSDCDVGKQTACIDYQARITACRDTQARERVEGIGDAMFNEDQFVCVGIN
jgi:hypothetical protein